VLGPSRLRTEVFCFPLSRRLEDGMGDRKTAL
jgi:hypothetical protein